MIILFVSRYLTKLIESHKKEIYSMSDKIICTGKKLSAVMLIYFTFSDVVLSFTYKIMMNKIYFNPDNLHMIGIILGSVLYIIVVLYGRSSEYYKKLYL